MVLKFIYSVFLIIPVLINSGCGKEEKYPFDRSSLSFKNKFINENQFFMNGYYFREEGEFTKFYYFFENGYMHTNSLQIGDSECPEILDGTRDIPYAWGCFIVDEEILKVQTYDPSSRERYDEYKVSERWFEIVNDSTLRYVKMITPEGDEEERNQVYQFTSCPDKPDSINLLMD